MRFLVIGASGLVGSRVLVKASEAGHEAVGTRSTAKVPGLVRFELLEDRIAEVLGEEFFVGGGPLHVVVCAAFSQIDRVLQERDLSYRINVTNTSRLIDDLVERGGNVVFVSTTSVFDGTVGYYSEEDARTPSCEYGRQKAAIEEQIEENGIDAFVVRLDKVFSDDPSRNHPFAEWWQWLYEGKPITCIEGQLFAPTFVDDIARGIVLGCELGLKGIYHLTNPEFFTRDELARQFVRAMGRPGEVVVRPQSDFSFADDRPPKSYLDSTRFRLATGMRFTSMREVFRSFRERVEQGGAS